MRYPSRIFRLAALAPWLVASAHAEFVTLQFTGDAEKTVESLGTKFIVGCGAIALGMVAAAFVSRKK